MKNMRKRWEQAICVGCGAVSFSWSEVKSRWTLDGSETPPLCEACWGTHPGYQNPDPSADDDGFWGSELSDLGWQPGDS